MYATQNQLQFLNSLLGKYRKQGHEVAIDVLCDEYSQGRTSRPEELTSGQISKLIEQLKGGPSSANQQRRKILSMAIELGWVISVDGALKSDLVRVDRWCTDYGYLHKPLNDHKASELPDLVSQFQRMYLKNITAKPV